MCRNKFIVFCIVIELCKAIMISIRVVKVKVSWEDFRALGLADATAEGRMDR